MDSCKITFRPSEVTVEVPSGTLLHEAASQAGVEVALPCGAQGRCGRCKVKVEEGQVARRDDGRLTEEQVREGWVLSCVARVETDAVVTVPPKRVKEKAIGETAADKIALPLAFEWPLDPWVRKLPVQMEPPTLENNNSDWDRLRLALEEQHGLQGISLGLPAMRRLARSLRAAD
ncbi:MAG TPA: 2Fe-2S iron-sulfur cluster-binding protein, partial [Dehalococcoidia bacterium]|nr:2Fe-2S iron-sulfur cluster-binding protein [Dehalococcoidia bacterium]